MMSKIEWTDATWNPIVGCSIVSPGCTNCYAMRMAARLEAMGTLPHYVGMTKRVNGNAVWTGKVALAPDKVLMEPLRRKKPTMYFVNSMGDLFHEDVPDEWIDRVFAAMALCPQHTFQVLTKRSARMRDYCSQPDHVGRLADLIVSMRTDNIPVGPLPHLHGGARWWPLANVWLGVSAERQQEADARIPDLLATPAAVRFVSAEPLLGPIDLTSLRPRHDVRLGLLDALRGQQHSMKGTSFRRGLDWVIVGGESGRDARPMHPDWPRSIRDQCAAAGVPFFFKQWGAWALFADGDGDPDQRLAHRNDWMLVDHDGGLDAPDDRWPSREDGECAMLRVNKKTAGRLLDGREHNDMPSRELEAAE